MKTQSMLVLLFLGTFLSVSIFGGCSTRSEMSPSEGIDVYADNPFCWQYDGEPTLLLGASDDDNLIQHDKMMA